MRRSYEVYHVSTIVLDLDHSQESRELVSRFTFSGRFDVALARSQAEVTKAIDSSDAAVALVIHAGFAQLLRKGQSAPLQVIVDGTNSNTALIALGYVNTIAQGFAQDYAIDLAERTLGVRGMKQVQVTLEQRPWFNPDLNGRWFFVPGLIGTLTLVIIVNLTAFAIVREREVGTLEQIMVSPIRPHRVHPRQNRAVLRHRARRSRADRHHRNVVVSGTVRRQSAWCCFLARTLFLLSALALGLLISTVCSTQQQAFSMNFFVLNPFFILSGFAYPISSMPQVLQWFTYANPLRYYLVVIRGTFLKGVGLSALWPELAAMAALAAVLLTTSILRFRKSLE